MTRLIPGRTRFPLYSFALVFNTIRIVQEMIEH